MKKAIILSLALATLVGCSTAGYKTASHNGKMYYFPKNCGKYVHYPNSDKLDCYHKGSYTGYSVWPAAAVDVANHYAAKDRRSKALASFSKSMSDIADDRAKAAARNKTTFTDCTTRGNRINCTSY